MRFKNNYKNSIKSIDEILDIIVENASNKKEANKYLKKISKKEPYVRKNKDMIKEYLESLDRRFLN